MIFKKFLEILIFLFFKHSSVAIIKMKRKGINTNGILVVIPIPVKRPAKSTHLMSLVLLNKNIGKIVQHTNACAIESFPLKNPWAKSLGFKK